MTRGCRREEEYFEVVYSRVLMPSSIDRLEHVFKPGITYEDWIPQILVVAEICKLGLDLESWISHLSVGAVKLEDWCLRIDYVC